MLQLMGVAHRLDFTTHKGRVFPDVVLTDVRDNVRPSHPPAKLTLIPLLLRLSVAASTDG
jgi:hypothetical protein